MHGYWLCFAFHYVLFHCSTTKILIYWMEHPGPAGLVFSEEEPCLPVAQQLHSSIISQSSLSFTLDMPKCKEVLITPTVGSLWNPSPALHRRQYHLSSHSHSSQNPMPLPWSLHSISQLSVSFLLLIPHRGTRVSYLACKYCYFTLLWVSNSEPQRSLSKRKFIITSDA